MSCQKGNSHRSRPQKHQNHTVFKNDLYDKTHKTKFINSIEVANVCERCKKIIEWKIKYKKYKPLKASSKCTKCEQKTVKHAYHIMCLPCARQLTVCPKCGEKAPIVESKPDEAESIKQEAELQALLKKLPERKRRTFIRYMNQNVKNQKHSPGSCKKDMETSSVDLQQNNTDSDVESGVKKEEVLTRLKCLVLKEGTDNNFDDFENFNDDDDDDDNDDEEGENDTVADDDDDDKIKHNNIKKPR